MTNNTQVSIHNRAFKYGDSLFETIRMFDGKLPFLSLHYDRLKQGMNSLGMISPPHFSLTFLEHEIRHVLPLGGNHRVRYMVYRSDGGLYTPTNHHIQSCIETIPLKTNKFKLNPIGLKMGITSQKYLSHHAISQLKTGNSLPYILAGIERQKNAWDSIFLLNQKGEIAEALSANLFLFIQNKIYTPPLSSGCVAGTIRRFLLEKSSLSIQEKNITVSMLYQAEAALITNAIQGVQWVESVHQKKYLPCQRGEEVVRILNQQINSV